MKILQKTTFGFLAIFFISILASCPRVPQNELALYQRSVVVTDPGTEARIISQASLVETNDTATNNIKILFMKGTPYEIGFQHGKLLREDIQANISQIIRLVKLYASDDIMDEVYDLMDPYIPREEKEEMRGLAHGANLPLRVIHWFHCIPEVSEYGPKKRFRRNFKATSCSNVVAFGNATMDGQIYHLRILDWIRDLGAQKYPVIMVRQPDKGNASVTFSYAGFIGCVSGMNEKQMTFGEMGYGDPPGESLEGIPFIFLFRKLMREADTLEQAKQMIVDAKRTCSYVYMISDAKAKAEDVNALLFITDRGRVKTFGENTKLVDERSSHAYPPIDDVVYGGAEEELLYEHISKFYGKITPSALIDITKHVCLKGNMQNVIFKPKTLEAWVSNAASTGEDEAGKASNQKYFYFNFGDAFKKSDKEEFMLNNQ